MHTCAGNNLQLKTLKVPVTVKVTVSEAQLSLNVQSPIQTGLLLLVLVLLCKGRINNMFKMNSEILFYIIEQSLVKEQYSNI